ncbi:MAG TPA: tetratricopeptide repeat protein [Geobacteraceae bacterium]
MLTGEVMAMRDRKVLPEACTLASLAALLLFACAWGTDAPERGAGATTSNHAPATERAGGKIDNQIARARADIRANPANASCHVRLAYLLVDKGALEEAMKSFDEALKINPRACDAKTGRGVVLARRGRLQEAEQTLQDALLMNPNPVRTHYELGLVYERLGDQEKAVAELKEGIKKHEQGRE